VDALATVLGSATTLEHEQVQVFKDPQTGLIGAIAIHSTARGPAMGGVRLASYRDVGALVEDALRLSRAMTFKNASADLDLGGGKAVLFDDGRWEDHRLERFSALAGAIKALGGRYIAAEDVGTTPADMDVMRSRTRWVAGTTAGRGDPSAATAATVVDAICCALEIECGRGVRGSRIGVLGVGNVGGCVARAMAGEGADVVVADIDATRASALAITCGAEAVPVEGFLARELDVLVPCALGGVITSANVGALRTRIVAGAANNQLEDDSVAELLADAGILYVPDFLANCGGIIHVGAEVLGFSRDETRQRLSAAGQSLRDLLRTAVATGRLPLELAYERAAERLPLRANAPWLVAG
jgi:glutamate dehydrogenase/leucine dehydrogenase